VVQYKSNGLVDIRNFLYVCFEARNLLPSNLTIYECNLFDLVCGE